jgi:hypothetical protein
MRRWFLLMVVQLGLALGLTTQPALAASRPVISGDLTGQEVCFQFVCGAAIFTGTFKGRVGDDQDVSGTWTVRVTHQDLPTSVGGTAAITGGDWQLLANQLFGGKVQRGTITFLGDDQYRIETTLQLRQGGNGSVAFVGVLDHRPLNATPPSVPTVTGQLQQ